MAGRERRQRPSGDGRLHGSQHREPQHISPSSGRPTCADRKSHQAGQGTDPGRRCATASRNRPRRRRPGRTGPWAVRMLVDGKPACTGTAVTRQWIISASHCFFMQGQPIADRRISFRVGSLDMRKGATVRPLPGKRAGSARADMMLICASCGPTTAAAAGTPSRAARTSAWRRCPGFPPAAIPAAR
ncbi:trypsin-like serine protease [Actinomadura verrucosospora]|uniref:trypsin-like serine protease n=1 Tax=Actinomadura verrucosospora TaxID=46165 RepID=UPI003D18E544